MAATGLLAEDPDHSAHMMDFATGMLAAASTVLVPLVGHGTVRIRIGMNSGTVVSVACARAGGVEQHLMQLRLHDCNPC